MGLKINAEKTKTMAIEKQHEELQVRLGTEVLEQVTRFVYLGELITEDGRCEEDVSRRIELACTAFRDSENCGEKRASPLEPR